MSESKSATNAGGVGFLGLLTVLFVGLRLTGHIDWPWLWVLAPLWGGFALFLVVLLVVLAATAVMAFWPHGSATRKALKRSAP